MHPSEPFYTDRESIEVTQRSYSEICQNLTTGKDEYEHDECDTICFNHFNPKNSHAEHVHLHELHSILDSPFTDSPIKLFVPHSLVRYPVI